MHIYNSFDVFVRGYSATHSGFGPELDLCCLHIAHRFENVKICSCLTLAWKSC